MSKKPQSIWKWVLFNIIISLFIVIFIPLLIGNNKMILKNYNRIEINSLENSKNIVIEEQEEINEFKKYTSSVNFKPL